MTILLALSLSCNVIFFIFYLAIKRKAKSFRDEEVRNVLSVLESEIRKLQNKYRM